MRIQNSNTTTAQTYVIHIFASMKASGKRRRRHAPLARVLKSISKLDKPRLAARGPREAYAERRRFGIESVRKRRRRLIGNHSERDDDRRISRFCRNGRAGRARKHQRI